MYVYLLGGSKWLLANTLIFVALTECTLHGVVLRGDLTSCVGREGQEASFTHMHADILLEAQPGVGRQYTSQANLSLSCWRGSVSTLHV